MNVLILGQGGREHALAWRLSQDEAVQRVLVMPGNPGMLETKKVELIPGTLEIGPGLVTLIKGLNVDLVVVGPEAPLCDGLVDQMRGSGIAVLGPLQAAARLEGSKSFSKKFMQEFEIPTADFKIFTDADEARAFVQTRPWGGRLVIKASELAQGKGVVVSDQLETQLRTIADFLENPDYPVKSRELVIEECVAGQELSVFALCDGEELLYLGEARDHKRLLDGDQGPNTGGMGCFSAPDLLTPELRDKIIDTTLRPVLAGMKTRGHPFRGFLFAGLMIDGAEINVLEYNVRFGDPEAQTLMPLLKGELAPVLRQAALGSLATAKGQVFLDRSKTSVHVVMSSKNYPGLDGQPLLLEQEVSCEDALRTHKKNDVWLFFAGVKKAEGTLLNSGGRVLGVTALGEDLEGARTRAYENLKKVHFEGAHFRKDIGVL